MYECLSEWGQILCAICPNPKLVITGGTSTAICVWETGTSKERAKSLVLKQVSTHDVLSGALCFCSLHVAVSNSTTGNFLIALLCLCCSSGFTGPHRRCNVSDGVVGVPHRCQRLPGSNLHHLGPQQAFLRHTAQGTPGARLCSVYQRTDGGLEHKSLLKIKSLCTFTPEQ